MAANAQAADASHHDHQKREAFRPGVWVDVLLKCGRDNAHDGKEDSGRNQEHQPQAEANPQSHRATEQRPHHVSAHQPFGRTQEQPHAPSHRWKEEEPHKTALVLGHGAIVEERLKERPGDQRPTALAIAR